jgi:hypothetical protein
MMNRTYSMCGEFKKFINGFCGTYLKTHQVLKKGTDGRKIIKRTLSKRSVQMFTLFV